MKQKSFIVLRLEDERIAHKHSYKTHFRSLQRNVKKSTA